MEERYLLLKDLYVYKLSLDLSRECWVIFDRLDWHDKKIMGDQFITAVDSVGANIAEGYGRYHYLDRIKFYYNSRGSLLEAKHWTQILKDRNKISGDEYTKIINDLNYLNKVLNNFIGSCYQTKNISIS